MSQRLSALLLSVCCVVSITVSAHAQSQSGIGAKSVVLEITIIETDGTRVNEVVRMKPGKDEINRLVADGKGKLIASLEVRTRTGENFSARVGQRVPIQTSTLPALRTNERNAPDSREPAPIQTPSFAIPQIQYENTGLAVDGSATVVSDGLLDIKLKIELSGLDQSTGRLTPAFTQRSFTDVVRMKESETAMLIGLIQPSVRSLSLEQIASGGTNTVNSGMIVFLTTNRFSEGRVLFHVCYFGARFLRLADGPASSLSLATAFASLSAARINFRR